MLGRWVLEVDISFFKKGIFAVSLFFISFNAYSLTYFYYGHGTACSTENFNQEGAPNQTSDDLFISSAPMLTCSSFGPVSEPALGSCHYDYADVFDDGTNAYVHYYQFGPNDPECAIPVDTDDDGVIDEADNCPNNYNPDQTDTDGDLVGDVCDISPLGSDIDEDGVSDSLDNCIDIVNSDQLDTDGDGIGDACDHCAINSHVEIVQNGFGWLSTLPTLICDGFCNNTLTSTSCDTVNDTCLAVYDDNGTECFTDQLSFIDFSIHIDTTDPNTNTDDVSLNTDHAFDLTKTPLYDNSISDIILPSSRIDQCFTIINCSLFQNEVFTCPVYDSSKQYSVSELNSFISSALATMDGATSQGSWAGYNYFTDYVYFPSSNAGLDDNQSNYLIKTSSTFNRKAIIEGELVPDQTISFSTGPDEGAGIVLSVAGCGFFNDGTTTGVSSGFGCSDNETLILGTCKLTSDLVDNVVSTLEQGSFDSDATTLLLDEKKTELTTTINNIKSEVEQMFVSTFTSSNSQLPLISYGNIKNVDVSVDFNKFANYFFDTF